MLSPKQIKYRKPHRVSLDGISYCGNQIIFGEYGIQARIPAWLTSRQVESRRRVLTRYVRRNGQLWIRIFPDTAITKRPAETRIGSGKGRLDYWVSVVRPGIVIFEVNGITENIARQAMKIASSKLPMKTKFVSKMSKF